MWFYVKDFIQFSGVAVSGFVFRVLLVFALMVQYVFATSVNGVRIWNSPDKTRAVFDLAGPVDYKVFTLKNPERVVIDLAKSSTNKTFSSVEGGQVQSIRYGQKKDGSLRLVIDVKDSARPRSFLLKPGKQYGHRLVVDLFPEHQSVIAKPAKNIQHVVSRNRDVIVAVDAGHGGEDPGAIGAKGTREKDVTLQISKKLVAIINKEKGMKAVLVRKGDYYIPLRKRSRIARDVRADLFISIHADSFRKRSVKGSSVFMLSQNGASSEAAKWLAVKENSADLVGGISLDDKDDVLASVLLDLSQSATSEASSRVAQDVLSAMGGVGPMHKGVVEKANFAVLKSPDVPSILVETAYISNLAEEKRLRSSKHQQKLAKAMLSGIRQYFYARPPEGTWIAEHARIEKYIVSRGDTLSGIAARYQVSVVRLKQANRLKTNTLHVGKVLTIPQS